MVPLESVELKKTLSVVSIEVYQYEGVRRHHPMIQRWVYPPAKVFVVGMYTLVIINSVFPSLTVIVYSSK